MRIARWIGPTGPAEGFVVRDLVIEGEVDGDSVDRLVPFPDGATVAEVLETGIEGARRLYERIDEAAAIPLDRARLLAPLAPASIRDFVAFEEHVEGISGAVDGRNEVVPEWYDAPTFYFTNPHTVRATGETVPTPVTRRLDFELELAAVIGGPLEGRGANLDAAAAGRSVFGYTIMNDWSARDLQSREMKVRLGPCKGKDFAITLGPWIVTADELEGFRDDEGFLALRGEARVNGELIGEDLFSNMGWPMAELVAYASRNSELRPGDVLGSGTMGNGGCLGELWGRGRDLPPLGPGDEVRLAIEGIGEIVNIVGERVVAPAIPPARPRSRVRGR